MCDQIWGWLTVKVWSGQLLVLENFCRYLIENKLLIIHSLSSFLVFKSNRSFELGNDHVNKMIKAQKKNLSHFKGQHRQSPLFSPSHYFS